MLALPTNPRTSPRASSSIDSLLLRDRDETTAWTASADSTPETRSYYVQNWRNDVVAMTTASGRITEWARYSAYGEARVRSRILGDYDNDGDIDADDTNAFFTDWNNSTGNADVDEDGDHDSDDITLFSAAWDNAHEGWQTGLSLEATSGNRLGYAGYHFDPATSQYHVRHRVYIPTLGRWTKRDPLGYVDGMNSYKYSRSSPLVYRDSSGLQAIAGCSTYARSVVNVGTCTVNAAPRSILPLSCWTVWPPPAPPGPAAVQAAMDTAVGCKISGCPIGTKCIITGNAHYFSPPGGSFTFVMAVGFPVTCSYDVTCTINSYICLRDVGSCLSPATPGGPFATPPTQMTSVK